MSRSRSGLTMVEVLVAVTIISLSLMPILYLSSRNVETARLDRVRVCAETIAHNALERFGKSEDNCQIFLAQNPSDPNEFSGANLWTYSDHLKEALGVEPDEVQKLIALHGMTMLVTLVREKPPGMDTLRCKINWVADRERFLKEESVEYVRYILREHRP